MINFRMQQSTVQIERFTERGAFRAQSPEIGGVIWIALDGCISGVLNLGNKAATDPAIRARGFDVFHIRYHASTLQICGLVKSSIKAITRPFRPPSPREERGEGRRNDHS